MRPLLLGFLCCACGQVKLTDSAGGLSVPPSLDLGRVFVGTAAVAEVTVTSAGRATQQVTLHVDVPFTLDADSLSLAGGDSQAIPVRVTPAVEGVLQGVLLVGDAQVALIVEAVTAPVCVASGACVTSVPDLATMSCLEHPVEDGTACTPDACGSQGICRASQCVVATAGRCDDGNACTLDACSAAGQCVHLDRSGSCPAPVDPCRVARCDPATGCATDAAPDGTTCGPNDCATAQICMGGQCVVRPAPDGSKCSEPNPCQGPGTCQAHACVLPPPHDLVEAWHYQPQGRLDFDGVSDSDGNLYFVECLPQGSIFDACSARSLTRDGVERFATRLGPYITAEANSRQLISGTQWIIVGRTSISAIETVTGALSWERSLTQDISNAECCPTCRCPPGPELAPVALAADGLGVVHVGLAMTTTAFSTQRGAILTYGVEHGTVLNWRPLGKGVADLAFDAAGNLIAGLLPHPASLDAEVQSFNPSGAVLFSAPADQSPWPLSVFGTTALLGSSGASTSTVNGAMSSAVRASLASATHPLFDATGRWSVGRIQAVPDLDQIWLEVLDPTGSTLLSANAVSESGFSYQRAAVSEAVLAQGGVLVVAGFQGNETPLPNGPLPPPPWPGWSKLMGLRADGGLAFSCVIEGPEFTLWNGAVSLSANRWATLATNDCPVCDAAFGPPVLRVFAVPGLELQRSGWVTSRGDREHTGRSR